MCYALDVSSAGDAASTQLALVRPGLSAVDLRGALLTISSEESAMAGQAVALSQWHQACCLICSLSHRLVP